ncbi:DNA-3-methyladenine glycosylase 2 [Sinimarinibacterium sp. CAU 1509]|uniref:DNA-3-methyladenine glycosylase 2 n=1 Tax=Sinimarinibacterium sp. CAU 1509 TaxID=2562283 RepID=UPI00146B04A6|nr:DNA-3-methyladenine glycosylase 2 family protein [Sinimarinibacterium sp. CAU 1509]
MSVTVDLPVCGDLPWARLLGYLQPRLIPGVERVDDISYQRACNGGQVRVTADSASSARSLRIEAPSTAAADEAVPRVAHLFAVHEDLSAARRHLRRCPDLAPRIAGFPGLRPLGSWDAFELCVRTVIGQQVTVAAAGTLTARVVERCSGELSPARLLSADLNQLGMPGKRVDTLRQLASAVVEGRLHLAAADWSVIDAQLQALPGFGPWTRHYLAIRLGREPDAFPHSDIGLIRAAGCASPKALLQRAEAWRPYRALAAIYLWAA